MPNAPLRPCSACRRALVARGKCAGCTQHENRERFERREFDYSTRWWRAFRKYFISQVVFAGVVPCCGATLPGGPDASVSECRRDGRMTMTSDDGSALHLHHEPELRPEELRDRRAICDPSRIVLACRTCHTKGTPRRTGAFR